MWHGLALALSQLLAKLRDRNGRIAIPGFYDNVAPLSVYERKQFKRLPTTDRELQRLLGVKRLFGERGFTPMEQRSARPTFEINGLTSGHHGEGSKTIVPAWASAKITCRLVPNQRPARIRKVVCNHLKKLCPPTVWMAIEAGHGAEAPISSRQPAQRRRPRCGRCAKRFIVNRFCCVKAARFPS